MKKPPIIACRVIAELLEKLPDELQVNLMDYGLHRVPQQLTRALQEQIDAHRQPTEILIGYGLCGNGLVGLTAGAHTLVIPRCNDCISLLLGSHQAYVREFEAHPGSYYLSKGWLEGGSNPLSEYREYEARYGEDTAGWLMRQQYGNYTRIALVATTEEDLAHYRHRAREVAEFLNVEYAELLGSDLFVRRLVEKRRRIQEPDEDFVVVLPGDEVKQEMFLR